MSTAGETHSKSFTKPIAKAPEQNSFLLPLAPPSDLTSCLSSWGKVWLFCLEAMHNHLKLALGAQVLYRREYVKLGSEFSLENEVFKLIFFNSQAKHGNISTISLWLLPGSCELCFICTMWHCGKFSMISLWLLPSMWVVPCSMLCVHALWEIFHDFVAAIAVKVQYLKVRLALKV